MNASSISTYPGSRINKKHNELILNKVQEKRIQISKLKESWFFNELGDLRLTKEIYRERIFPDLRVSQFNPLFVHLKSRFLPYPGVMAQWGN